MEIRSQTAKVSSPIPNSCDGRSKVTEASLMQQVKHEEPMIWSDDGSWIDCNDEQFAKQNSPSSTSCDPDSNSTEERAGRPLKQETPISFTDAGMTIDLNL
jgi:hypothetical protein